MYKIKDIIPVEKKSKNSLYDNARMEINRDLTSAEEKEAFLFTSKVNSARIFAKYLD